MKRASIIAIVPVVVLLAVWTIPGSAAEDTPKGDAAAPAAKDAPPDIPEINEAFNMFRERDAEGALKLLKKVCKKHPEISPAHVILARFFARANGAVGMRNALEEGVKELPNDPEAYIFMADIAMRERRVTEARLLYEKCASLMPKFDVAKRKKNLEIQVLAGLATTSEAREDWVGAQQYIEAWLKLDSKSVDALRELAGCLLRQKNETGALEQLVKASKIDPEQHTDLLSPEGTVAQFYWKTGEQDKAKKWMFTALTAKPRDLKTRLLAAQWAWETGQLTEAEKQASAALQLDPQSLEGLILRGLIARYQKNYKAAAEYCQKAVLLKPNLFAPTNNLALALVEQNSEDKKQRALEYAETNAQKYQKTNQASEAYSTYGWVLYKLDRLDDAEKALRASISGGQFSLDTAYYLGRVLAKRGRDKDAIQFLESALKTPGPFAYREDAKRLLEELKK